MSGESPHPAIDAAAAAAGLREYLFANSISPNAIAALSLVGRPMLGLARVVPSKCLAGNRIPPEDVRRIE
jgi:hypothetical protein